METRAEKKKFSYTKKINDISKTFSGEEVENGWVITIDSNWTTKDPINGREDYKYECKKYISKDNPLDKLQKKDNETPDVMDKDDVSSMLNEISVAEGMLLVD